MKNRTEGKATVWCFDCNRDVLFNNIRTGRHFSRQEPHLYAVPAWFLIEKSTRHSYYMNGRFVMYGKRFSRKVWATASRRRHKR